MTRLGVVAAMNLLQSRGVVSDNCVTVEDIAALDAERAAEWLRGWRLEQRMVKGEE